MDKKSMIIASIKSLLDIAIFFERTDDIVFYKEQLQIALSSL